MNKHCELFTDNNIAIEVFKDIGLIKSDYFCPKYKAKMKLQNRTSATKNIIFRCSNRDCRKISSLFTHSVMGTFSIELKNLLFIIFKWLKNCFIYDIVIESNLTRPTISKLIKKNTINIKV